MTLVYDAVIKIIPSYAQLFGETGACDCEHCESVLGPAAYFVDLLQFLSRAPKNGAGRGPLDILLDRRPDLQHVLLTCENSNTPLPAIDLANEILESVVVFGKVDPTAAHDTGDATAEELAANPQHVLEKARDILSDALYPASLPFDFRLETARGFFKALGTSRHELMQAYRTDALKPLVDLATEEAISGEFLSLTKLDFELITAMQYAGASATQGTLADLYGLDAASLAPLLKAGDRGNAVRLVQQKLNNAGASPQLDLNGEMDAATVAALTAYQAGYGIGATGTTTAPTWAKLNLELPETPIGLLSWVTEFLGRSGISFTELVALLKSKTFNPFSVALDALEPTGVTWKDLDDLKASGFTAPKPPIVVGAAALGMTPAAFVQWLKERVDGIAAGIVIEALGDPCDIARSRLRRIDGEMVLEETLIAMSRFLRLARRLGLTVGDLDCALTALRAIGVGGTTDANLPLSLSAFLRLKSRLKLSIAELGVLLNHFETGPNSLFSQLFLNRAALALDPSFGLSLDGWKMANTSELISNHEPALLAAFRISADELAFMRKQTGLDAPGATLNLSVLSRLYRFSLLARALGVGIEDLVSLLALSSPGPFDQWPDQPIRIERMVGSTDALAKAKIDIAAADQLLRHLARDGSGEASADAIGKICASLHNAQLALAADMSTAPDNSLERFRTLLGRVVGPEAVDQVLGIITGTASFTAPYDKAPAAGLADIFAPNVIFAADQKVVRFHRVSMPAGSTVTLGALTDGEKSALQAAAVLDTDLVEAVEALHLRPRRILDDLLAGLGGAPTLAKDLVASGAGALGIEAKLQLALDTLLPLVHEALAKTLIKQQLVGFTGLEAAILGELIEDSKIVTAPGSPDPLIVPYRALEKAGWSAEYFASTTLTGATIGDEAAEALDFDGSADNFGQAAAVGSARWSAQLLPPSSAKLVFQIETNGTPNLFWNGELLAATVSGDIHGYPPQAAIAGEQCELVVEWTRTSSDPARLRLAWVNGSESRISIPPGLLIPRTVLGAATAGLVRLDKAARLLRQVPIEPGLLRHVAANAAAFGGFCLDAMPVERTAANEAAIDAAAPSLLEGMLRTIKLARTAPRLRGQNALLAILNASNVADAAKAMASAYGRDEPDLVTLLGPTGFAAAPSDIADGRALLLADRALGLARKLGISPSDLLNWAGSKVDAALAEDIKRTVRAKFSEKDWLSLSKGLNDELRERWRDALVAFLVPRMGFTDPNQLFEYLFLDTQVACCVESSRIRHCTFAVQTFVQRTQLNLHNFGPSSPDTILPSAIDAEIWEPKKYYRVQEAARKVLMFPERYMRQGLRDDQTAEFRQMVSDFGRAPLTRNSIETAYLGYLKRLDEIARLEVCGSYVQKYDAGLRQPVTIVHMIARSTLGSPYNYYYRRLENDQIWTAWERVPIDIDAKHDGKVEGVHLVPVIWNRRLYVFWLIFEEKSDGKVRAQSALEETLAHRKWKREHDQWQRAHDEWQRQYNQWWKDKQEWERYWESRGYSMFYPFYPPVEPPEPIEPEAHEPVAPDTKHLEIRLAWCEYFDGRWSSKQVSSQIVQGSELKPELYHLKVMPTDDGKLYADLVSRHHNWSWVSYGGPYLNLIDNNGPTDRSEGAIWKLSGVTGKVETIGLIYGDPPGQSGDMWIVEPEGTSTIFNTFEQWPATKGLKYNIGDYLPLNARLLPASIRAARKQLLATLDRSPSRYRVTAPHHYPHFVLQGPSFYQDHDRTYIVTPATFRNFRVIDDGHRFVGADIVSKHKAIDFNLTVGPGKVEPVPIDERRARILDSQALLAGSMTAPQPLPTVKPWSGTLSGKSSVADLSDPPIFFHVEPFPEATRGVLFRNLFHPHVPEFVRILSVGGVDALLSIGTQSLNYDGAGNRFQSEYQPTANVATPYPHERVEFGGGSYSVYNWELFYHAPMLMSEICEAGRLFDDEEWALRKVLDISAGDATAAPGGGTDIFWQFLPFRGGTPKRIEDFLKALSYSGTDPATIALKQQMLAQIHAWERDPFNPFMIGRMRIGAMEKHVVLRWLQYLLLRATTLVKTERPEAVNEAIQYLVLAAHLAGPQPERVPRTTRRDPESYLTLKAKKLDAFSNALVLLENEFPFSGPLPGPSSPSGGGLLGMAEALYFCIPTDDLLSTLRSRIAQLLFNIRHCMNAEGIVRQLPLYEPPIDPMLLVQARAAGLDLGSVLNSLNAPLPNETFQVALERARQSVDDVRRIGGDLRSALDQRDNEALGLMRARQELETLRGQMRRIKQRQVDEAKTRVEVLREAENALTKLRIPFYLGQLGLTEIPAPGALADAHVQLSESETSRIASLGRSRTALADAGQYELMAKMMSAIPTMTAGTSGTMGTPVLTMYLGGHMLALGLEAFARMKGQEGQDASHQATLAQIRAEVERRAEQWALELSSAIQERERIDRELLQARIGVEIAEFQLEAHDRETEFARDRLDFLETKDTSLPHHQWMVQELDLLLGQYYQLAFEECQRCQQVYRFDTADRTATFVEPGRFDKTHHGLFSGEWLALALRKMERAHADQERFALELAKPVSLAMLDPLALVSLKTTGACEFVLPEELYDADFPGQYMRRIRRIAVTIPCVAGPYTTVNATLTLLNARTRTSNVVGADYAEQPDDPRFDYQHGIMRSIATSSANEDRGEFGDRRDGRRGPFEGYGAFARFRLELPQDTNAFDTMTITDALLRVEYWALPGGQSMANAACKLSIAPPVEGAARLFSVKHEFSNAWYRGGQPADPLAAEQLFEFDLDLAHLPFPVRRREPKLTGVTIMLPVDDPKAYQGGAALAIEVIAIKLVDGQPSGAPQVKAATLQSIDSRFAGLPLAEVKLVGDFPMRIQVKLKSADLALIDARYVRKEGAGPSLRYRLNQETATDLAVIAVYDTAI